MSLRTSPQTGVAIRFPPWLPLWGSCHEVTERVNIALSAFGTSPIGRGKTLIRLALAGDARATFPQGKAGVTDCHVGLRPPRNDIRLSGGIRKNRGIATPVCGLVRNDSVYYGAQFIIRNPLNIRTRGARILLRRMLLFYSFPSFSRSARVIPSKKSLIIRSSRSHMGLASQHWLREQAAAP